MTASGEALTVDVLVIGWGKGGKTLDAALAGDGQKVAMIEQFETMHGGTCINIGCVPTKALVHDAQERREDDDAAAYWARAVGRRDTLIGKLRDVNHHMLADLGTVTLVDGRARFVAERTVEVAGGEDRLTVTAPTVVVNTGAVPVRPDLPGIDSPHVHDSTSIQHADPFPQLLAVVGAGPVGLEFASMFAGFGAEVTVLNRGPQLLRGEEPEVVAALEDVLEGDGITVLHEASVQAVEEGPVVVASVAGAERRFEVDAVLLATGRRPATEGLGLEAAGIGVDGHGAIVVDEHLRTSAHGVFAIGDVHGGAQQTYLSLDDHRIVLSQLTEDGSRSTADRVAVPTTTFVTPPLSAVGLTEAEAREAGHEVLVAVQEVAAIKAMPRPKTLGDARGIVKLVVDAATDELLGARLFHVDSQEVVNLLALAMRTGTTATQLRDGIWTHPSSTEALNETLGMLGAPERA
jgi:pyruvate/2-oxoglutarate dehydrogenase complex dihydrolipoamide dehydrogenase (E3) component